MKVRLAAQVMSLSVATALAECRELGLAGFINLKPTEKFLTHINDIFDVLNSRSMYQKGWKKPLSERNINNVERMFQEVTNYLLSLKEPATKRQVVQTNRKTGFLSFIICMQSMIALHNFLCGGKTAFEVCART